MTARGASGDSRRSIDVAGHPPVVTGGAATAKNGALVRAERRAWPVITRRAADVRALNWRLFCCGEEAAEAEAEAEVAAAESYSGVRGAGGASRTVRTNRSGGWCW